MYRNSNEKVGLLQISPAKVSPKYFSFWWGFMVDGNKRHLAESVHSHGTM